MINHQLSFHSLVMLRNMVENVATGVTHSLILNTGLFKPNSAYITQADNIHKK